MLGAVGGSFQTCGVDGEDLGWAVGSLTPSELACNPNGDALAGVHAIVLDGAMNAAIHAALRANGGTVETLEMTTEIRSRARRGERYCVRGDVVRLTRREAHAEASLANERGQLVSRATGTFSVHREDQR
jgi:acyl-coenzyme A thioesterase PaaI-like protein